MLGQCNTFLERLGFSITINTRSIFTSLSRGHSPVHKHSPRRVSKLLLFSKINGWILAVGGLIVLVGWYASIPALTYIIPGWATMKANTAFCFLLLGITLNRATRTTKVHADRFSIVLLLLVALIAFITLVEYGVHRSWGIDELLIKDYETTRLGEPPGRMSFATSISFVCLSMALLLVDYSAVSCIFSIMGITLSLITLVGFLYKAKAVYAVRPFSTIALHTAGSFLLFGLGVLTLRRGRGIALLLTSSYADVAMTRPLLLSSVFLPLFLGLLCLGGQRAGWYPAEFTLGVMTVMLMVCSSLLLWWTSRVGWKIDKRRRLAQKRLASRTNDLSRSNTALAEYSYAAAHDLQEPLRIISLSAEMLNRVHREQFGPDEREYLHVLKSSAQRINRQIKDLLVHGRILSEEEPVLAAVDMNEVLRDVLAKCKESVATTGVRITVERLPIIYGNQDQLVILFHHLVENGIAYRNRTIEATIDISAKTEGAWWVLAVSDNGIGFEMKYSERIFGLFKRLHALDVPGTGMGLAICKCVVDKHKGRIWAESQPNIGSVFKIAFSIANAKQ